MFACRKSGDFTMRIASKLNTIRNPIQFRQHQREFQLLCGQILDAQVSDRRSARDQQHVTNGAAATPARLAWELIRAAVRRPTMWTTGAV